MYAESYFKTISSDKVLGWMHSSCDNGIHKIERVPIVKSIPIGMTRRTAIATREL